MGKIENEAIRIFCSLTPITRMFQSSGMGWARYVVRTGDRHLYRIAVGTLEGIHLQDCRRKDNSFLLILNDTSARNYNNT